MRLQIVNTTDGKFLGQEFDDDFPIELGGYIFSPSAPPMNIGDGLWRFYNSNYSIDAQEI